MTTPSLAALLLALAAGPAGAVTAETPATGDVAGGMRVSSPRGEFDVEIDRLAVVLRRRFASERNTFFEDGAARAKAAHIAAPAATPAPAIRIDEQGRLVGVFERNEHSWIQPVAVNTVDLNDDGRTARVVMTGGRFDGRPALFVRILDAAGVEKGRVIVEAFHYHVEKLD